MILATGGYIGRIPRAPGTAGSLLGLPVACGLGFLSPAAASAACLALIAAAVWVAGRAERQLGAKDPGCIVIDEIVGMTVTMFGIPLTLGTGAAGFILFRVLDIWKPPPARQIDRRLRGGWGVVLDDVAAGVLANAVLRVGLHLLPLMAGAGAFDTSF